MATLSELSGKPEGRDWIRLGWLGWIASLVPGITLGEFTKGKGMTAEDFIERFNSPSPEQAVSSKHKPFVSESL
jgi:hypothetical protein